MSTLLCQIAETGLVTMRTRLDFRATIKAGIPAIAGRLLRDLVSVSATPAAVIGFVHPKCKKGPPGVAIPLR